MKTSTFIPSTLAGAALLAGCLFDDGSKTAAAKARFDIQAIAASSAALAKTAGGDSGLVISDNAGVVFTITEARAYLDKVKLIGAHDDCDDDDDDDDSDDVDGGGDDDDSGDVDDSTEAEAASGTCGHEGNTLNGPFVVDLLTGATTPAMGDLEVPAGTYHKVKIHLGHAKRSDGIVDSADPLSGKTLFVKGTYAAAGMDAQPFTLALKFDEEVEMENLAGIRLDAATLSNVLVSLRVDGWLAGMDVAECLAKPEVVASLAGGAVISEDSELGRCLDIETTVKENIRRSFEVEDDEDNDGKHGDEDDHDHDGDEDDEDHDDDKDSI